MMALSVSKICNSCREDKHLSAFYRDKSKKDGLRHNCKDCHNFSKKQHYNENKEQYSEKAKVYYINNKDKLKNSMNLWRENNKDKDAAKTALRRANKKQATPTWVDKVKIKLIYKKAKWLEKLTGLKYHVDHIIPLQGENVCGLHCWANLQILEASLNISKGNK